MITRNSKRKSFMWYLNTTQYRKIQGCIIWVFSDERKIPSEILRPQKGIIKQSTIHSFSTSTPSDEHCSWNWKILHLWRFILLYIYERIAQFISQSKWKRKGEEILIILCHISGIKNFIVKFLLNYFSISVVLQIMQLLNSLNCMKQIWTGFVCINTVLKNFHKGHQTTFFTLSYILETFSCIVNLKIIRI